MKRIKLYALAILAALVPAVLGLWGNASFSRDLPVRVPARAETTPADATSTTPASVTRDDRSSDRGSTSGHDDHGDHDDHGGRAGSSSARHDDRSGHDGGVSGGHGSDD